MNSPPRLALRTKGELACFSRPEFKTERASYPFITPSAGRAIFEAVLWKPAIRWEVRRISLLRPVRFVSFRRNEISTKIAPARAKPGEAWHYTDGDRAQRNTVALRDVDYLLEADLYLTEKGRADGEPIVKFIEMFRRRLDKGQQFHQPYLGCREFAADVMPPSGEEAPIDENLDAGRMFYDMAYAKNPKKGGNAPMFFEARMAGGVIDVPSLAEVAGARS